MKYIFLILFLMVTNCSVAQTKLEYGTSNYLNQKLDKNKFEECKLIIPIDYEKSNSDLKTAKEYINQEIVVLTTKGKKIVGYLRGFIEIDDNIIYFNPIGEHITTERIPMPVFDYKQMKYFDANCFDQKNK